MVEVAKRPPILVFHAIGTIANGILCDYRKSRSFCLFFLSFRQIIEFFERAGREVSGILQVGILGRSGS